MEKLKRVSILIITILILFTTKSFAKVGKVDAPSGLILRKEASKQADVITTINNKEKVEVLEQSGEWYKVKYGNHEGYMFAKYVNIEKEENKAQEEKQNTQPEQVSSGNGNKTTSENDEHIQQEETYPKTIEVKSNIKIYIIPSIMSSIIGYIEEAKTININYVLNGWANITYENCTGWIRKFYINNQQIVNNEVNKPKKNEIPEHGNIEEKPNNEFVSKKGYINVESSVNVREQATTKSKILTTLLRNTEVKIVGEEADFYKVQYNDYNGYIAKELISDKPVEALTNRSSKERKQTTTENIENNRIENVPVITNSNAGQKIVDFAKQYLGYSYVSGGTSPDTGFDCSGFTYYVYNQCGYKLSRSCSVQANAGTSILRSNLQTGDLLVFNNGGNGTIGHVGIYIGGGKFIHAANSRRGVVTDTINSGYYNTYYGQARRIVN